MAKRVDVDHSEAAIRTKDLAFMKDPEQWPKWPMLPLKLWSGDTLSKEFCGFLYADGTPTVYLVSVYRIADDNRASKTWGEVLKKYSTKTFSTFEELAEIYRVD